MTIPTIADDEYCPEHPETYYSECGCKESKRGTSSEPEPTMLRWGLGDVMWGDDDSVTVMLSGPAGEPYWLELDPERAAALRQDLAGPDADTADQPAEQAPAPALTDVKPDSLDAIARHLEGRAVTVLRPDGRSFADWHTVAAVLRRAAAEARTALAHISVEAAAALARSAPRPAGLDALLDHVAANLPAVEPPRPYQIPALTKAEVAVQARTNRKPADCEQCTPGFPVPHWPSTVGCRSSFRRDDNGIERLFRVHCTCDYCF